MTLLTEDMTKDEVAAYKRVIKMKGVKDVSAAVKGGMWSACVVASDDHQAIAMGDTRLMALHNLELAARTLVASIGLRPHASEVTAESVPTDPTP